MCDTHSVLLPILDVDQALLVDALLVAGREEEEQAGDVDVPHPVDPGHEGPCVLQILAWILCQFVKNELHDGEGEGEECEHHQEPEPPDSAVALGEAEAGERPTDQVGPKEKEVDDGGDASEDNNDPKAEKILSWSQPGPDFHFDQRTLTSLQRSLSQLQVRSNASEYIPCLQKIFFTITLI